MNGVHPDRRDNIDVLILYLLAFHLFLFTTQSNEKSLVFLNSDKSSKSAGDLRPQSLTLWFILRVWKDTLKRYTIGENGVAIVYCGQAHKKIESLATAKMYCAKTKRGYLRKTYFYRYFRNYKHPWSCALAATYIRCPHDV